jgi:hypothetical protein
MADAQAAPYSGRTAWARNLAAPVRAFLATETGSASVLLAATIAALLWANSPWSHSYESVWTTRLSVTLGGGSISADLRQWVDEGFFINGRRHQGAYDAEPLAASVRAARARARLLEHALAG